VRWNVAEYGLTISLLEELLIGSSTKPHTFIQPRSFKILKQNVGKSPHPSQLGLTTTGLANICAVTGSAATAGGATATGGMTMSTSQAAAPHVMGAIGAGFTGTFGFLGVMAAL